MANYKNFCVFPLGSWLESLINVITAGHGKSVASWIAWTFFKNPDCGCTRRKNYLNKIFNCEYHEQIKL